MSRKSPTATYRDIDSPVERDEQVALMREALSDQSRRAKVSLDQDLLKDVEIKRRILRAKEREASRIAKSVFISFTGKGMPYFRIAERLFVEAGFEIFHGFDDVVERGRNLTGSIISRIRASSVFIGIWTQDFDASSISGIDGRGNHIPAEGGGIPGVWMPLELGVAAAERKPFKILFESGMHRQFIEKPFGTIPHIPFVPMTQQDCNFEEKCRLARDALGEWYDDVVEDVDRQIPSVF